MSELLRIPGTKPYLLLAAALVVGFAMAQLPAAGQDSSYIRLPNQDQEMEAAKAKARATLPHFWDRLANPGAGEEGFALKVALPYGRNSTEHIWTKDIERRDGRISGVINNVPRDVKTVRIGQRIEIDENQISDWLYLRRGKIVGNYTLRPLLKRMPPQEAARYRGMLESP